MRKEFLTFVLLVLLVAVNGCGERVSDAEAEIRTVMQQAEDGWNAGNLDEYMNCYRRSDDLRFASGDRLSFGWHQVLANYRISYPTKKSMGHLVFNELDITFLAEDAALVVGRWRLTRDADTPHGVFTLVMRRGSEGWRIIHDHTSSGDGP